MRRYLLWSFVALTVAFAPAPLPRAERRPSGPFSEIEGYWENSRTPLHITPHRYTHSADRDYELKIDTSVQPHAFDIRGIGRTNVGDNFTGIYKVEGDLLTVSYNSDNQGRPTSFDGRGQGYTEVFKRVRR